MKKLFLLTACVLSVIITNAQSLEEIINKYTVANKLDKIAGFETIKITAKTSMMGMELPMEIWMKKPNKIRTVTNFNGQEIIQTFDGEKGYMINPMTGSADAVPMTAEQIKDVARNNIFQNYMLNYLKNGQLSLEGEDNVNGKPAYKIKANLDGTNNAYMYIDKSSYLLIKTVADLNQGGIAMTVESYPSDYTETNGIILPMKTTSSTSGMEIVTTFTKVEVNVPMDDAIFKVK